MAAQNPIGRTTPPTHWERFRLTLANLPPLVNELSGMVRAELGRDLGLAVFIDGFDGDFESVAEIQRAVSVRDWEAAGHYRIALVDRDARTTPLTVELYVTRGRRATLTISGDRPLTRNGLVPALRRAIDGAVEQEARRRRAQARRLAASRRSKRLLRWAIVGAVFGGITAVVAVMELHPFS